VTVVDVMTLLAEGLAAHRAGRLEQAEACYRRALTAAPEQPDALHLLAVLALHRGRADEAQVLARRATIVAPTQPTFWSTLGVAEQTLGQLDESVRSLRRAVDLAPDYAEGWANLAITFAKLGRAPDEASALERLTALDPAHGRAWGRRGVLAFEAGAFEEAEARFARAVAFLPDDAEAWCSLGLAQLHLGRFAEAEAAQRRAIALNPDFVTAQNNLGNVLVARMRWAEAMPVLERVVQIAPDHELGWTNLGFALNGLERFKEACAAFERALALRPEMPLTLIGLGDAYQGIEAFPEAIGCYERASHLAPDNADLWKHLGVALQWLGRLDEAAEAYRRCLSLDPSRWDVENGLIFVLDMLPGTTLEQAYEARRAFNEHHAAPLSSQIRPHANTPDPDRRLRVGYVSADFRHHSAAMAFLTVLEHHDPAAVEVVCYSNSVREDHITERFKAAASLWRVVTELSDEALAAQIRTDEIDVLVDLSGYSQGNRLLAFARKPAPVQVTAWGYATGTSLDAMDAYFTDPVLVPPHEERWYSEQVVHLPNVLCYTPPTALPPIRPLPALENGYVTFGSYNRAVKITPAVLETWARVLLAVPNSRLVLKPSLPDTEATRDRLLGPLAQHGIDLDRVEILGRHNLYDHLDAFNRIDLQLDTFPHSGGVTTLDGLLMGIPCVTLLGERVSGRASASFLAALGLDDLVAHSVDEYVELAVRLAGDLDRLARERTTLRERLLTSPIGDGDTYTRAVEAAYRELWQAWCDKPLTPRPPLPREGEGSGEGAFP
jgi:predicted O-linked N-acetylglucosamine transferase (SPINDLY family)